MDHETAQQPGALLINDAVRFNPDLSRIMRKFARSKPWRGTIAERVEKLQALHADLCELYSLKTKLAVRHIRDNYGPSNGHYDRSRNTIELRGKVSVVTYLHCFCYANGETDRKEAFRWSLNLFKKFFPISFSRCHFEGYLLIRN